MFPLLHKVFLPVLFVLPTALGACDSPDEMSATGTLIELSEAELFETVRDILCHDIISRCTAGYDAEECINDADDDSAYQDIVSDDVRLGLEVCLNELQSATCEAIVANGPEGFAACDGLARYLDIK